MVREAVILAGGAGTRLQSVLKGSPKALVDILGIPLLEHQLAELKGFDFHRITILVRYEAEAIRRYCERCCIPNLRIRIIEDRGPRGTAGAFFDALELFGDNVLVVYGDLLFSIELDRFMQFHEMEPQAPVSLVLHPTDHPQDADIVELADDCLIDRIHRCPHRHDAWLPNMVNAAIYCVRPRLLRRWAESCRKGSIDFAKDLFPRMLAEGARLRGYVSREYIKDIGTPERLEHAREAVALGIPGQRRLEVRQPAVFMDRDGTIVGNRGYIREPADLRLLPGVSEALRLLEESGYQRILVTNQPVVARGECTEVQLRCVHNKMETLLGREGAFLNRIYYCPHHPDAGFQGEVQKLKLRCNCRKPRPGMLYRARDELNLDMRQSWMVGDSAADCGAAANAGVTSILLTRAPLENRSISEQADLCFSDMLEAARFITTEYAALAAGIRPLVASRLVSRFHIGGDDARARSLAAAVLARELSLAAPDAAVKIVRLVRARHRDLPLGPGPQSANRTITVYEGPTALELKRAGHDLGLGCVAWLDRGRSGISRVHITSCA